MSVRRAVYGILTADATVGAAVINSGNSNNPYRVYLSQGFNGETKPYIIVRADMIDHSYTKQKTSTVDTFRVELDIYHDTLAEAETLALNCRTALQGYSGTIDSVVVDGCHLVDEGHEKDPEEVEFWTQDYELRLVR